MVPSFYMDQPHLPVNLEPYHRLIALQKQIVLISRQNEKTRVQCALLRDGVRLNHRLPLSRPFLLRKLSSAWTARFRRLVKPSLLPVPINEQAAF